MNHQQFIISTLKPYFENPSLCGYDFNKNGCSYLTPEGKMCAAGKHVKPEHHDKLPDAYLYQVTTWMTDEAKAQNLSLPQWDQIQSVHDHLAIKTYKKVYSNEGIMNAIKECEQICEVDLSELKSFL